MDTKRKITLQESKVIPTKIGKKVKLSKRTVEADKSANQAVVDKLKGGT